MIWYATRTMFPLLLPLIPALAHESRTLANMEAAGFVSASSWLQTYSWVSHNCNRCPLYALYIYVAFMVTILTKGLEIYQQSPIIDPSQTLQLSAGILLQRTTLKFSARTSHTVLCPR
jgi:hypothetical protein